MLASHTLMAEIRTVRIATAKSEGQQERERDASLSSSSCILSTTSSFVFFDVLLCAFVSPLCSAVLVTRLAISVFSSGSPDYSLISDWARTCG